MAKMDFGVYVIRIVWRVYNTQFLLSYDKHIPLNPNPTHRVAYTRQSPFLHSHTTIFVFIWRRPTIYTDFHEIGLNRKISY